MAKRVIYVYMVTKDAEYGLHCDVCGNDGRVRIPVLYDNGVGMIDNCLTCLRRKRDECSSE